MTGTTAYVQAVNDTLSKGDSTEHSFRPALKSLIETFDSQISVTNEPKRAEHNAPDFDVKVKRAHGWLSIGTEPVNLNEARFGAYY